MEGIPGKIAEAMRNWRRPKQTQVLPTLPSYDTPDWGAIHETDASPVGTTESDTTEVDPAVAVTENDVTYVPTDPDAIPEFKLASPPKGPRERVEKPVTSIADSIERTPQESDLELGTPERTDGLGGGCNETVLVKIVNDGSGVFKPSTGEKPFLRTGIEAGTYFKRERAAYLVSKMVGIELVPPTVIRELDGETGSMQQFIEDAESVYETDPDDPLRKEELMRLFALDYIIWNTDRHGGNILFNKGKVVAIDNGLAFGKDTARFFYPVGAPEWNYGSDVTRFTDIEMPEDIKDNILSFVSYERGVQLLSELLGELLPAEEVQACIERIKRLARVIEDDRQISLDECEMLTYR